MILIGLGSNLGDRAAALARAEKIMADRGIRMVRASSVIETPALLPPGAPEEWNLSYFNRVVAVETDMKPEALLEALKDIEKQMGRTASGHWGPREIDLDLLAYHDEILTTPMLSLPHPGMGERRFVLEPLNEIAPGWRHPVHRRTPAEMLAAL